MKFFLSGFLVIMIMVISFLSIFYAFELMFQMWHAELLLSCFFSLMFFNIYIFLIQTFSKEVFPVPKQFKFFNLSNLSRMGFVLLIGFLIAQPVKIFFVRHKLDRDIATYKTELYNNFCRVNTSLYKADLDKLNKQRDHYTALGKTEILTAQIIKIDSQLGNIDNAISSANSRAHDKINRSNFFIKRVEFAGKYPIPKFIMFIVLAIFFAPVALIYSISGNSKYYQLKKHSDRNLVIQDYNRFKKHYSILFSIKHGVNTRFYEHFVDPPFNTTKKPEPIYFNQEDFFNNLLNR